MRRGRIDLVLDGLHIAVGAWQLALLMSPVLHEHGQGRGAASFARLMDKGNVDPEGLRGLGRGRRGEQTGQEHESAHNVSGKRKRE